MSAKSFLRFCHNYRCWSCSELAFCFYKAIVLAFVGIVGDVNGTILGDSFQWAHHNVLSQRLKQAP